MMFISKKTHLTIICKIKYVYKNKFYYDKKYI